MIHSAVGLTKYEHVDVKIDNPIRNRLEMREDEYDLEDLSFQVFLVPLITIWKYMV